MIYHDLNAYMGVQRKPARVEISEFSAADAVYIKKFKDTTLIPILFTKLKKIENKKIQVLLHSWGYAAGGFFCDSFHAKLHKDIDIYLKTVNHVKDFMELVTPEDVVDNKEWDKFQQLKENPHPEQVKPDSGPFAIKLKAGLDVIVAFCGDPDRTTSQFDMFQCMSYFDFSNLSYNISPLTYRLILDKRILWNVETAWTIQISRFKRYLDKGYHYIAPVTEGDLTIHFMDLFKQSRSVIVNFILPVIKWAEVDNQNTLIIDRNFEYPGIRQWNAA